MAALVDFASGVASLLVSPARADRAANTGCFLKYDHLPYDAVMGADDSVSSAGISAHVQLSDAVIEEIVVMVDSRSRRVSLQVTAIDECATAPPYDYAAARRRVWP